MYTHVTLHIAGLVMMISTTRPATRHNTLSCLKQVIGSDFLYLFAGVSDDLSDPVVGEDCEAGCQPLGPPMPIQSRSFPFPLVPPPPVLVPLHFP